VEGILAQDVVQSCNIDPIADVRDVVIFDQMIVSIDAYRQANVGSAGRRARIRKRVSLNKAVPCTRKIGRLIDHRVIPTSVERISGDVEIRTIAADG